MQFLNKYKNISEPLKASIWFTVCNLLQKGIQFITVPIFTRILSPEDFGTINVYNSWFQILLVVVSLNLFLGGVFNVGMIKFEDTQYKYMSCSQCISIVSTLIFFLIYILFFNFWNNIFHLPSILMMAMFIHILFYPSLQYWSGQQRFNYKYRMLIFVTLLISILELLLNIVTIKVSQYKAPAKILSSVFVQGIIGIIFLIYILYKGKTFYDKKYWSHILCFAIPLIPHYLSTVVLVSSDRIIIDRLCDPSFTGIYSIGYTISSALTILNTAINDSFIPWTFKKMKNKDYNQISPMSNIILVFIGLIIITLIALIPELVKIIAPSEYYEAIWVVPPVAMSVLFMFMYNLFANIEFYFEANKFITIASIIAAVLNIILNYLFIPIFGYIAAAYTTLICYVVYSIGHYLFMKRLVKLRIGNVKLYNIRFIFMLSLLLIILSVVIVALYNYPMFRYLIILIFIILAIFKKNLIINAMNILKNN